MKLIDNPHTKFGQLEWKGKILTLLKQAYIGNVYLCHIVEARYFATAYCEDDSDNNLYHITWVPVEGYEEIEDESQCCNWDEFYVEIEENYYL